MSSRFFLLNECNQDHSIALLPLPNLFNQKGIEGVFLAFAFRMMYGGYKYYFHLEGTTAETGISSERRTTFSWNV